MNHFSVTSKKIITIEITEETARALVCAISRDLYNHKDGYESKTLQNLTDLKNVIQRTINE